MSGANLLVVEDDPGIREMMSFALETEGYDLTFAPDCRTAWEFIQSQGYDLVLLDWMLPDNSGIDLLHRIRSFQAGLPVIMVTAKDEEEDMLLGLDVGADDYITKPFSTRELKSRIKALLRRTMSNDQPIQVGVLFLDPVSQRVQIDGKPVEMAPREFRLLHFFMGHPDRVYSRTQLLDEVWGMQVYVEERTVDVHVRRVRKHLERGGVSDMLQTVRSRGYRFSRLA